MPESKPTTPPPTESDVVAPGSFEQELRELINHHSLEGGSGTPDFILARFLRDSLDAFDAAVRRRELRGETL